MFNKIIVTGALLAATSLFTSAQTSTGSSTTVKSLHKAKAYSEVLPAIKSGVIDIPQSNLSEETTEALSKLTPLAPAPPLTAVQIIDGCDLPTASSTTFTCEPISSGQLSTVGQYPSSLFSVHIIIEVVGFGTISEVKAGGSGSGTILPPSTLVFSEPLCLTGSGLGTCSSGQTEAGFLYEYDVTDYLKFGRLTYTQSTDINNILNTKFSQVLIQD
jgi:Domain of unknown function (DUF4879)